MTVLSDVSLFFLMFPFLVLSILSFSTFRSLLFFPFVNSDFKTCKSEVSQLSFLGYDNDTYIHIPMFIYFVYYFLYL